VMVRVTELRAHAEELAERERRYRSQRRVLSETCWLMPKRGNVRDIIYEP
jgi:hypothetical protein